MILYPSLRQSDITLFWTGSHTLFPPLFPKIQLTSPDMLDFVTWIILSPRITHISLVGRRIARFLLDMQQRRRFIWFLFYHYPKRICRNLSSSSQFEKQNYPSWLVIIQFVRHFAIWPVLVVAKQPGHMAPSPMTVRSVRHATSRGTRWGSRIIGKGWFWNQQMVILAYFRHFHGD